jgi:membrane protein DedA with SNARE-associated domain
MELINLNQIFDLLIEYRYFLLFPITIIEGPIITVMAGYLSHLGLFNIYAVYCIVVIGDLVGDIIYYLIGKNGRLQIIDKWGHYFGIHRKNVLEMEKIFENHSFKTLFFGKFTFGIGGIIIIAAGAAKVPITKFIFYSIIGTLPKSFLLILAGTFIGSAYLQISKYFDYTAIVSILLAIIILAGYYFIQRYAKRYIKKESL